MTWRNALGFLMLGVGMLGLPAVAPGLVAAHGLYGTSTRELWLLLMGAVNVSLGSGVLGWQILKLAARIPALLVPAPVPLPQPRPALRPALRRPVRAGVY